MENLLHQQYQMSVKIEMWQSILHTFGVMHVLQHLKKNPESSMKNHWKISENELKLKEGSQINWPPGNIRILKCAIHHAMNVEK